MPTAMKSKASKSARPKPMRATERADETRRRAEIVDSIAKVMQTGLSFKTACDHAAVDSEDVEKWLTEDPSLGRKIRSSAARTVAAVSAKLVGKALAGDLRAMMFYLRARTDEYRERANDGSTPSDDNSMNPDDKFV